MGVIDRYIVYEILQPLGISFFFVSAVMILTKMFDLVSLMLTSSPFLVIALVASLIVALSGFLLPLAFLIGCCVAFARLSVDMEITALRSLGVPAKRLAYTALAFGGFLSLVLLVVNLYIAPWGNRSAKALAFKMLLERKNLGVVSGGFSKLFGRLEIYASEVEGDWIRNLFIFDVRKKGKTTIIEAKKGRIEHSAEGGLTLRLFKGRVLSFSNDGKRDVLLFDKLNRRIATGEKGLLGKPLKRELSLGALIERLKREKRYVKRKTYLNTLMHFHKRFALAFSPLVFALLSIPFSMLFHREGRWSSMVISVAIFLSYYAILSFFQSLVYRGIPPVIAAWMPNIILGAVGGFLFVKRVDQI